MTPVQPILIFVLLSVVFLYFSRVRSTALVGLVVLACSAVAFVLVIDPELATRIAHLVGVGRGVDLIMYFTVPALVYMILVLYGKCRELDAKLTMLVREDALSRARAPRLAAVDHSEINSTL